VAAVSPHWAWSSQHPSGLANRKKPEQVVVGDCPEGVRSDHVSSSSTRNLQGPALPGCAAPPKGGAKVNRPHPRVRQLTPNRVKARDRARVIRCEAHLGATETTRNRSFAHQRAGHGALAVTDAGHLLLRQLITRESVSCSSTSIST
jgi:hypothetical protein